MVFYKAANDCYENLLRFVAMPNCSVLPILFWGCLNLASCVGTTPVEGDSQRMVFQELRGDIEMNASRGGASRTRDVANLLDVKTSVIDSVMRLPIFSSIDGFEFALSSGESDFEPTGSIFEDADFRLSNVHAAFRGGGEIAGRIRIEALTGLEYSHFELSMQRGTQPVESDNSNHFGPLLGAQVAVELVKDQVFIYARETNTFGFGDSGIEKTEVGLKWGLSSSLRLLLAYRQWRYQDQMLQLDSEDVSLDLEMTGVVIGMEVRF